jgi:hypothetical protein
MMVRWQASRKGRHQIKSASYRQPPNRSLNRRKAPAPAAHMLARLLSPPQLQLTHRLQTHRIIARRPHHPLNRRCPPCLYRGRLGGFRRSAVAIGSRKKKRTPELVRLAGQGGETFPSIQRHRSAGRSPSAMESLFQLPASHCCLARQGLGCALESSMLVRFGHGGRSRQLIFYSAAL